MTGSDENAAAAAAAAIPGYDVMTWVPRKEDYLPVASDGDNDANLSLADRIQKLNEKIEVAQQVIRVVVDGDDASDVADEAAAAGEAAEEAGGSASDRRAAAAMRDAELNVFRCMDVKQDAEDFQTMLQSLEVDAEKEGGGGVAVSNDALRKAKVGLINIKAYLKQVARTLRRLLMLVDESDMFSYYNDDQVDVTEFTAKIASQRKLMIGCTRIVQPWLDSAEKRLRDITTDSVKPVTLEELNARRADLLDLVADAVKAEARIAALKEAASKAGDVGLAAMSNSGMLARLCERYAAFRRSCDGRVSALQHLAESWARLNEALDDAKDVADRDDAVPAYVTHFLHAYAAYFGGSSPPPPSSSSGSAAAAAAPIKAF